MEQVEVWQGRHGDPVPLLGPLPGVRQDDTLAYEFGIPSRLVPWPGRSRLMRVFVLLDLGVALSIPAWQSRHGPDQDKSEPGTCKLDAITAVDGLRRWQRFLDRHLHAARDPSDQWTDFPPRRLRDLAALPAPLGPVVTMPD